MIMSVTLGLSWPLLTIVLDRQGVPAWLVGLSASGQMVAVLAVVPVAPSLISKIGVVRTIGLGIIGMAVCLALQPPVLRGKSICVDGRGFRNAGPSRARLERADFGGRGVLRTRETQGRRA